MRIAILAHGLRYGGGISVGKNLIAALGRIAPHNEYFITIPAGVSYEEACSLLNQRQVFVFKGTGNTLKRLYYETVTLPQLVNNFSPDAVLALGNIALQRSRLPQVLYLHNPYYVYPRRNYGMTMTMRVKTEVAIQRWLFARDLQRIQVLCCQTQAMTKRVRSTYHHEGRIEQCPNVLSEFTVTGKAPVELPKSLERVSNKRRLFYLTAYYSHKNLEVLLDLFRKYGDELSEYAVVITISPEQSAAAADFLKSIDTYRLGDHIVNVGPLSQADLAIYFGCAQALFMPTLLESLSGTYLEAMHFGVPILTTDADFAREACGDAAVYFDPANFRSMVDAIKSLDSVRDGLIERGRNRLHEMCATWDNVGRDILSFLEDIVIRAPD